MTNDIRYDVLKAHSRFRIHGNSMVPTFLPGDVVIVDQVQWDVLVPGDCVYITTGNQSYVHRYLGQTKKGILTKGDAHRIPDPAWDASAIRGRVIEVWRNTDCIYTRTPHAIRRDRFLANKHRVTGFIWKNLARVKAIFTVIFFCFLISSLVMGAVTLADFEVDPGTEEISIYWETASEVGNLGFYLWRSESQSTGYYKLPIFDPNLHFIPSIDEGAGAFYEYVDDEVTPGVLYYYKLQDYPANGNEGEYSQPLSAGIGLETATPTLTPSLTPTATPTQNSANTSTPTPQPADPSVLFWTDSEDISAGECATVQWQTANVKAVYLNGEGVPGVGAKAFCPCVDETHTLDVDYQDNSRHEYTIDLSVTGQCDPQIVKYTITPTLPATHRSEYTPTATFTPQPLNMPTNTKTPILTRTVLTSTPPKPTPTTEAIPDSLRPETLPTNPIENTPTSTRVIVVGQNSQQPILEKAMGIIIFAGLAGFSLVGVGIWLWRRR